MVNPAATPIMTDRGLLSRQRRRTAVSLSSPVAPSEPVGQLDQAIDLIHQVTRTLPDVVPDREELIAIGGLLAQISGALLTFTDRLVVPVYDDERALDRNTGTTPIAQRSSATAALQDCRDRYLAASASARAFHAAIKSSTLAHHG